MMTKPVKKQPHVRTSQSTIDKLKELSAYFNRTQRQIVDEIVAEKYEEICHILKEQKYEETTH
jgi:hypothetical protein